jgi:hypothetical protein
MSIAVNPAARTAATRGRESQLEWRVLALEGMF